MPATLAAPVMVALFALPFLACDGKTRTPRADNEKSTTAPNKARTLRAPDKRKGFVPPNADQRLAAIGDLKTLPADLRKAFAPSDQFSPITAPASGEWLAEHDEEGQSYQDYVDSKPNRAKGKHSTIYLVPVGDLNKPGSPRAKMLVDYVARYYQMPVKMLPKIGLSRVSNYRRINNGSGKPQLLTGEILTLLKKKLPQDAYCLIAVTETDLYPQPSWNFVFGMASLSARVGVFSFARYHPSFHGGKKTSDAATKKKVLMRALKVMTHEIGHMFGIQHCTHYSCVMNGSNSMDESDGQPEHLCPVCLRKLHHAHAFGPAKRYTQLREFYDTAGLKEQSTWARQRIKTLAKP